MFIPTHPRYMSSAEVFYDTYGIKAIPNDIGTGDMFEKLTRLQNSGIYDVDVVLVSNTAVLYKEFVDYDKIF